MHPVDRERRKSERFQLRFCMTGADTATAADFDCVTHDVSAGGLGVVSTRQVSPGQCLDVWLTLPDNAEKIHTRGRVVWSSMVEAQRYRAGIVLDHEDLNPTALGLRMLRMKLKTIY